MSANRGDFRGAVASSADSALTLPVESTDSSASDLRILLYFMSFQPFVNCSDPTWPSLDPADVRAGALRRLLSLQEVLGRRHDLFWLEAELLLKLLERRRGAERVHADDPPFDTHIPFPAKG